MIDMDGLFCCCCLVFVAVASEVARYCGIHRLVWWYLSISETKVVENGDLSLKISFLLIFLFRMLLTKRQHRPLHPNIKTRRKASRLTCSTDHQRTWLHMATCIGTSFCFPFIVCEKKKCASEKSSVDLSYGHRWPAMVNGL